VRLSSVPRSPPHRLVRAAALLAPKPRARILEIGCGNGVLADLICSRLRSGKLTALDRSPLALRHAKARNAAHVRAGTIEFIQADLADAPLSARTYDTAIAVHVNCFWTGYPAPELAALRATLKPAGKLWLFYESLTLADVRLKEIAGMISAHLRSSDFNAIHARIESAGPRPLLILTAQVGS
jgi:SAM-dependent methyltransferase